MSFSSSHAPSEKLVLKRHVVLRLQADTSPHHVDECAPLLAEGVDDGCAGGCEWCLEHVAQDAEHGVEPLPFAVAIGGVFAP